MLILMTRILRRYKSFYGLVVGLTLLLFMVISLTSYSIEHKHNKKKVNVKQLISYLYDKSQVQSLGTSNYWKYHTSDQDINPVRRLILPQGVEIENPESYVLSKKDIFHYGSRSQLPSVLVGNPQDPTVFAMQSEYTPFNITIFSSNKNIGLDLTKCNTIQSTNQIEMDNPIHIDINIRKIMEQFLVELPNNQYYQEISPFFLTELKLQLKHDIVDHYWYRLAGSSVWLEQYGVHFMISRILFSPKGRRNQPSVSLMYAQIFDENWLELTNTELTIPSNDQKFKLMKFPQFLPIPFYHDYDNIVGKYYGPEDPRLILIKNKYGYQEPLIVFNAYHRKLTAFDDDMDEYMVQKSQNFRSMFICWPWQSQIGKTNMDSIDKDFLQHSYSKVLELKIKNLPRQQKQKNWTPFRSYTSITKEDGAYDDYLYFIYRWANFETLKCNLEDGICGFNYRLNDNLSPSARVGPLRGGTQLINLNELITSQSSIHLDTILPPSRQIWVGFARAHIDDCGCGANMYRPNMVILVKDKIKVTEPRLFGISNIKEEYFYEEVYRLSHVSSSISFNIPLIGWDLFKPRIMCEGSSVLIPNGISGWTIKTIEHEDDASKWKFDDYLTLSLSVSDYTVHTINIKGLLREILQLDTLFLSPKIDQSSIEHELRIPNSISDANEEMGFNNDNVVCALHSSVKFCSDYAIEQEKIMRKYYRLNTGSRFYDTFITDDDGDSSNEIDKYKEEVDLLKGPVGVGRPPLDVGLNNVSPRPPVRSQRPGASQQLPPGQNRVGNGDINSRKPPLSSSPNPDQSPENPGGSRSPSLPPLQNLPPVNNRNQGEQRLPSSSKGASSNSNNKNQPDQPIPLSSHGGPLNGNSRKQGEDEASDLKTPTNPAAQAAMEANKAGIINRKSKDLPNVNKGT
ncbi:uncharacterized protein RJT21DRAFT_55641 [Scheffersomyces amazonensis]|uniref:uncharacterized protein n=1 Tax=Scheffersomyces amazonensis TaxID=1078765 RepID=UPI00315C986B